MDWVIDAFPARAGGRGYCQFRILRPKDLSIVNEFEDHKTYLRTRITWLLLAQAQPHSVCSSKVPPQRISGLSR